MARRATQVWVTEVADAVAPVIKGGLDFGRQAARDFRRWHANENKTIEGRLWTLEPTPQGGLVPMLSATKRAIPVSRELASTQYASAWYNNKLLLWSDPIVGALNSKWWFQNDGNKVLLPMGLQWVLGPAEPWRDWVPPEVGDPYPFTVGYVDAYTTRSYGGTVPGLPSDEYINTALANGQPIGVSGFRQYSADWVNEWGYGTFVAQDPSNFTPWNSKTALQTDKWLWAPGRPAFDVWAEWAALHDALGVTTPQVAFPQPAASIGADALPTELQRPSSWPRNSVIIVTSPGRTSVTFPQAGNASASVDVGTPMPVVPEAPNPLQPPPPPETPFQTKYRARRLNSNVFVTNGFRPYAKAKQRDVKGDTDKGLWSALGTFGAVTEGLDLIDAVAQSLPQSVQKKYARNVGGQVQMLYDHWKELDPERVAAHIIMQNIDDAAGMFESMPFDRALRNVVPDLKTRLLIRQAIKRVYAKYGKDKVPEWVKQGSKEWWEYRSLTHNMKEK